MTSSCWNCGLQRVVFYDTKKYGLLCKECLKEFHGPEWTEALFGEVDLDDNK